MPQGKTSSKPWSLEPLLKGEAECDGRSDPVAIYSGKIYRDLKGLIALRAISAQARFAPQEVLLRVPLVGASR